MREPRHVVVLPVRFAAVPPVASRRVLCSTCLAECWLSLRAVLVPGDGFECVPCAVAAIAASGEAIELEPAPWVRADLRRT
jgi:hypothetical protein